MIFLDFLILTNGRVELCFTLQILQQGKNALDFQPKVSKSTVDPQVGFAKWLKITAVTNGWPHNRELTQTLPKHQKECST